MAAGALPDGTPVIISGGDDGTVRVWRLADGTPVGEPLRGHDGWVTRWRPGRCRTAPRSSSAAARTARCGCGGWPTAPRSGSRCAATTAGCARWRPGRCRTAPRSSSAAARTARCGCGGWPTAPRSGSRCRPRRPGVRGGGRGAAGRHPGHRQRRRRTARCGCGGWPTAPRSGSRCAGHTSGVRAVAAGALPDGTPVIISGGEDGTVRVWRLADGTPVGEPLRGHDGGVTAVAAGALPDGTPVIISGGERRHGAGVAAGRRHPGRGAAARPRRRGEGGGGRGAAGRHPGHHQRRRTTDARCGCGGWPTAPRSGSRCPATPTAVSAVAAGALPDGTPVIVSGGDDGTVRVWRLADGTPLVPPLDLPEPVRAVAVHGNVIVTAAGADIAVHQPALPRAHALAAVLFPGTTAGRRNRSDNGRLSGTTRTPASDHVGGGPPPCARLGHVIRYIC